jgi:predicted ester cyclase
MATVVDTVNPVTGFTHEEMKSFIRNHFEDFVNKQDLGAADRNMAASFVDRGDDVPPNVSAGVEGAKQYLAAAFKRFPDIHVRIEDMVAEGDKVVVRNWWTATDTQSGQKIEFRGIVIWRIQNRQIVERWAYLQKPHPAE